MTKTDKVIKIQDEAIHKLKLLQWKVKHSNIIKLNMQMEIKALITIVQSTNVLFEHGINEKTIRTTICSLDTMRYLEGNSVYKETIHEYIEKYKEVLDE